MATGKAALGEPGMQQGHLLGQRRLVALEVVMLEMQRIDFLAHKLCLKRACFDYYHAAGALRKAQARLIRGKCDSWPCSLHGKGIGMKGLGFTNFPAMYRRQNHSNHVKWTVKTASADARKLINGESARF